MKNKAFTLVELMVVIAIIAILAVGSVTSYSVYLRKANVSQIINLDRHIRNAMYENMKVEYLFDSGDVTDTSGNENHGELVGGTELFKEIDTSYGMSASFESGSSDYIRTDNDDWDTDDFTASIISKSKTDTWNSSGMLVELRGRFMIHPMQNTKNMRFYIWRSTSGLKQIQCTIDDITKWNHYMMTIKGQILTGWINGEICGSIDVGTETRVRTNDYIQIGRDSTSSTRFLDGYVDHFRYFTEAYTGEGY